MSGQSFKSSRPDHIPGEFAEESWPIHGPSLAQCGSGSRTHSDGPIPEQDQGSASAESGTESVPIDTRPVLEREPWQVPLWDAINRFRDASNIIQRERAVVEVNDIVRSFCERARAAEGSFRQADLRATAIEEGSAEWEARAKDAEQECVRLRGALEILVMEEAISAGRARELHGMSIDHQRAHYWRWYHGGMAHRDEADAWRDEAVRLAKECKRLKGEQP